MMTTEESSDKGKQSQHTFHTNQFLKGRKKETAPSGDVPTASVYRTGVRLHRTCVPRKQRGALRRRWGPWGTVPAVSSVLVSCPDRGVCIHYQEYELLRKIRRFSIWKYRDVLEKKTGSDYVTFHVVLMPEQCDNKHTVLHVRTLSGVATHAPP